MKNWVSDRNNFHFENKVIHYMKPVDADFSPHYMGVVDYVTSSTGTCDGKYTRLLFDRMIITSRAQYTDGVFVNFSVLERTEEGPPTET